MKIICVCMHNENKIFVKNFKLYTNSISYTCRSYFAYVASVLLKLAFHSFQYIWGKKAGGGGCLQLGVIFAAAEFPRGLVIFTSIYMLCYVHIFCP